MNFLAVGAFYANVYSFVLELAFKDVVHAVFKLMF